MNRKGVTITYIVKAFPMNYDEGYGNVSIMKKVHIGSGDTLPFTSRQALRYSLVNWLFQHGHWREAGVTKEQEVIQFDLKALKEYYYEEADLFGYMITPGRGERAITRSAVARLTHLVGLDRYFGDQEFLTNKGFADRKKTDPNLANIEIAYNYYKYTLSIDLDQVGIDENIDKNEDLDERIRRVQTLIEATKFLYRNIRGRREDLKPLFVIGGVYPIKSPFFHNAVNVIWKAGKPNLNMDAIEQVLKVPLQENKTVGEFTYIGGLKGEFENFEPALSPFEALDKIKEEVKKAYEGN